jgi:hypothetical protein
MLRIIKLVLSGCLFFAITSAFSQGCPGPVTTVTVAINEDATITTSTITCTRPGANFGPNDPQMADGHLVANSCLYKIYLQATNLLSSGIPSNAVIYSASLKLTATTSTAVTSYTAGAQQYLEVASMPWAESTINGSNAPVAIPVSSAFPAPVTYSVPAAPANSSVPVSVDVTSQMKFMMGSQFNNGWSISMVSPVASPPKNIVYRSSEYTLGGAPYLEIKYYLPLQVSATVTHATSAIANDGAVDLTITGGSGNYTYQWYTSAGVATSSPTTQDQTSLVSDYYKFRVHDQCFDEDYYGYALVGIYCKEVTFDLKTDPDWGYDSYINNGGAGFVGVMNIPANTNYGTNTDLFNQQSFVGGLQHSLIRFRYFGITPDDNVSAGRLNMFANGTHAFNSLTLLRVTQDWKEQYVTWVIQPALSAPDAITTTGYTVTPDAAIDVLPMLVNFQLGTATNYGFLTRLTSPSGVGLKKINFFSSDYTTNITKRPSLAISFTAVCPAHAHLRVKPDGYNYEVRKILTFYHNEEYEDPDVTNYLIYKIIRISDNKLMDDEADYPLTLKYGDNRCFIPLSSLPTPLAADDYMLEVTNQKKEKTYLKFKVIP